MLLSRWQFLSFFFQTTICFGMLVGSRCKSWTRWLRCGSFSDSSKLQSPIHDDRQFERLQIQIWSHSLSWTTVFQANRALWQEKDKPQLQHVFLLTGNYRSRILGIDLQVLKQVPQIVQQQVEQIVEQVVEVKSMRFDWRFFQHEQHVSCFMFHVCMSADRIGSENLGWESSKPPETSWNKSLRTRCIRLAHNSVQMPFCRASLHLTGRCHRSFRRSACSSARWSKLQLGGKRANHDIYVPRGSSSVGWYDTDRYSL